MSSSSNDQEPAESAAPLIGEWYFYTLVSFNEMVGRQRMIEALTPYFKEHGAWGWLKIKDRLSSCRSSVDRMANMIKFGACVAGFPNVVSVTSIGVVYWIYSCQNREGDPIFCDVHDLLGKALISSMDDQYDHNYVRRMSQGSPFCLGIIAKKGRSSRCDDCGEMVRTISEPPFSEQEMALFSEQYASQIWALAVSAFVDTVGADKALSSMLPIIRNSGITHGYRYAATIELNEGGIERLIPLIGYFNMVFDQEASISNPGDHVQCIVTDCPFQGSSDEVCLMFDTFMEGICQSVHRDLNLTTKRDKVGQDQICTWRISKDRSGH